MGWVWLWAPLWGSLPASVEAQTRSFHGFYLGAEASREDLIGGSFVDGVDFLAQDMRGVASLLVGVRLQTSVGVVLGLEGTWGRTDGDLTLDDPERNLRIDYANDSQTSIGGMAGYVPGGVRSLLIFAYASEVTRRFDVQVTQGGTSFDQKDKQGMLRYGLGVEVAALRMLHVRFRVGSGRADFGNAVTNITPDRSLEAGLGVVVQF